MRDLAEQAARFGAHLGGQSAGRQRRARAPQGAPELRPGDRVALDDLEQEQAPHPGEPGLLEPAEAELELQQEARGAEQQGAGHHEAVIECRRVPRGLGEHPDIVGAIGPQLRDEHGEQAAAEQDRADDMAKA